MLFPRTGVFKKKRLRQVGEISLAREKEHIAHFLAQSRESAACFPIFWIATKSARKNPTLLNGVVKGQRLFSQRNRNGFGIYHTQTSLCLRK